VLLITLFSFFLQHLRYQIIGIDLSQNFSVLIANSNLFSLIFTVVECESLKAVSKYHYYFSELTDRKWGLLVLLRSQFQVVPLV